MTVSNEDLRVSITELKGTVTALSENVIELRKAIEGGVVDRRSGEGRISALELSSAKNDGSIRTGKYFLSGVGICVFGLASYMFKATSESTEINRVQELAISQQKEQITSLNTRMTTEEAQVNAILRDQMVSKARDK